MVLPFTTPGPPDTIMCSTRGHPRLNGGGFGLQVNRPDLVLPPCRPHCYWDVLERPSASTVGGSACALRSMTRIRSSAQPAIPSSPVANPYAAVSSAVRDERKQSQMTGTVVIDWTDAPDAMDAAIAARRANLGGFAVRCEPPLEPHRLKRLLEMAAGDIDDASYTAS